MTMPSNRTQYETMLIVVHSPLPPDSPEGNDWPVVHVGRPGDPHCGLFTDKHGQVSIMLRDTNQQGIPAAFVFGGGIPCDSTVIIEGRQILGDVTFDGNQSCWLATAYHESTGIELAPERNVLAKLAQNMN